MTLPYRSGLLAIFKFQFIVPATEKRRIAMDCNTPLKVLSI